MYFINIDLILCNPILVFISLEWSLGAILLVIYFFEIWTGGLVVSLLVELELCYALFSNSFLLKVCLGWVVSHWHSCFIFLFICLHMTSGVFYSVYSYSLVWISGFLVWFIFIVISFPGCGLFFGFLGLTGGLWVGGLWVFIIVVLIDFGGFWFSSVFVSNFLNCFVIFGNSFSGNRRPVNRCPVNLHCEWLVKESKEVEESTLSFIEWLNWVSLFPTRTSSGSDGKEVVHYDRVNTHQIYHNNIPHVCNQYVVASQQEVLLNGMDLVLHKMSLLFNSGSGDSFDAGELEVLESKFSDLFSVYCLRSDQMDCCYEAFICLESMFYINPDDEKSFSLSEQDNKYLSLYHNNRSSSFGKGEGEGS